MVMLGEDIDSPLRLPSRLTALKIPRDLKVIAHRLFLSISKQFSVQHSEGANRKKPQIPLGRGRYTESAKITGSGDGMVS